MKKRGFTIVELLIVIVVIAILAAITLVAYNGVRANADDAAVKSNLSDFVEQLQEFYTINGQYPSQSQMNSFGFKIDQAVFATDQTAGVGGILNNIMYCIGTNTAGIVAVSVSGNQFVDTTTSGLQTYTPAWTNTTATTCSNVITEATTATGWGYTKANGWATGAFTH